MRISALLACLALLAGALALLVSSYVGAPAMAQTIAQTTAPIGCFRDSTDPADLDLGGYLERSWQNTPQRCVAACAARGFRYAGVQYGESCLCGQTFGRFGPAQNCSMRCTGDANQICGGVNANNVYEVSGRPPPPPTIVGPALSDRGLSVVKLSDHSIRIDWVGMPGGERDWVSLVPKGTADNAHVGMWAYAGASGTREYGVGTPLTPGSYEVRFYLNDGYTVYRRVSFAMP